ncbi:MAG: DUF4105 domain-containing protein [Pseudobacteriovorax sp.]|nr:DUF4105 domain-containing protein [Pseudobacteriovorax sp.]
MGVLVALGPVPNAFSLPTAIEGKELKSIWQDWLRLGHYKGEPGRYRSIVEPGSFFFAEGGEKNPQAELYATIEALTTGKPKVGYAQLDPICAFPARYKLLKPWVVREQPYCDGIEHWLSRLQFDAIAIVFASSYEQNPASLFGHLSLKLVDDAARHDFLNYGVAYGAAVDTEDGLSYMWRGLTGGYRGRFSLTPFYETINEYTINESRDLWEYRIELTGLEREWFLKHLWELMQSAEISYFFLDENCAFMINELLSVVFPDLYSFRSLGWLYTPHDALRKIAQTLPLTEASFAPSIGNKLASSADKVLPAIQHSLSSALDENQMPDISDLDQGRLLLDMITYRKRKLKQNEQDALHRIEHRALLAMADVSASSMAVSNNQRAMKRNNPLLGHKLGKIHLGQRIRRHQVNSVLRYRLGFHDVLDNDQGFESGQQINYFDIEMEFADTTRYTAHIIDVLNLAPSLPWESPWSWQLSGGMDNQLSVSGKSRLFGLGAIGKAYQVSSLNLLLFSLLTAELSQFETRSGLHSYVRLGSLLSLSEKLRVLTQWQSDSVSTSSLEQKIDKDQDTLGELRWDLDQSYQFWLQLRYRQSASLALGAAVFM